MNASPSKRVWGGVMARASPSWAPCAMTWHSALLNRPFVHTTPMVVCILSLVNPNGCVSRCRSAGLMPPSPRSMSPNALTAHRTATVSSPAAATCEARPAALRPEGPRQWPA